MNIHMEEEMSQKVRRDRKEKPEKPQNRKSSRAWRIGALIIGIGLVVGVFFFFPRGEPWGLPAVPSNPRSATLSSALFTDKVAKAYQIAEEVPELLERMPCYCGCYVNPGHRNNLDCYTDRHAVG